MEIGSRAIVSWSGGGAGLGVLVHGGAGEVPHERRPLQQRGCIGGGARRVDAAEETAETRSMPFSCAVQVLEDDPHFNAGTGASLTADGRLELDAALMEGRELRAGAVCALGPFRKSDCDRTRRARRESARALRGGGADSFARQAGFEPVDEAR